MKRYAFALTVMIVVFALIGAAVGSGLAIRWLILWASGDSMAAGLIGTMSGLVGLIGAGALGSMALVEGPPK